jgi:hypothetical protein
MNKTKHDEIILQVITETILLLITSLSHVIDIYSLKRGSLLTFHLINREKKEKRSLVTLMSLLGKRLIVLERVLNFISQRFLKHLECF